MDVQININCNNAAFADDPREEIKRILLEQAEKVRFYPLDGESEPFNIRDLNGNICGDFYIKT